MPDPNVKFKGPGFLLAIASQKYRWFGLLLCHYCYTGVGNSVYPFTVHMAF